jgi:hypothetical protein
MTKDYTAGRDMDCGESKSTYKEIALLYKESLNSKGERYVFNVKTDNDGMPPAHQVAFFEMKGQYPLLGFCASLDIPKADFLQVMDSVDIK